MKRIKNDSISHFKVAILLCHPGETMLQKVDEVQEPESTRKCFVKTAGRHIIKSCLISLQWKPLSPCLYDI